MTGDKHQDLPRELEEEELEEDSELEPEGNGDELLDGDEEDPESEEQIVSPGLSDQEELDEIFAQRGGGEAQRQAEIRRPSDSRPQEGESVSGRRLSSAAELFEQSIPRRSSQFGEKLHAALRGRVLVSLQDSGQNYLLDWSGDALLSAPLPDAANCQHDCRIGLKECDLLAVVNGELNPQIAMLSHKIDVSGRSDLAVYFFNLLAS